MDPSYQNVVDPADMVFTLLAYVAHGVAVAAQLGLSGFLVFTGVRALLLDGDGQPPLGGLRLALGLALLAPLALGAPPLVSLLASACALFLLGFAARSAVSDEPRLRRWARRLAIASAAAISVMMVWEREDNLALGADLLSSAMSWRNEELAWQLEKDPAAPKLGDLAPDFELQDPQGEVTVRLSDFRGVRPVALVFGSYT